jgi:hypothetical protein
VAESGLGRDVGGSVDVGRGCCEDLCSTNDTRSEETVFVADLNPIAIMTISSPTMMLKTLSHSGGKPRNRKIMTQTPSRMRNCLFDMWLV